MPYWKISLPKRVIHEFWIRPEYFADMSIQCWLLISPKLKKKVSIGWGNCLVSHSCKPLPKPVCWRRSSLFDRATEKRPLPAFKGNQNWYIFFAAGIFVLPIADDFQVVMACLKQPTRQLLPEQMMTYYQLGILNKMSVKFECKKCIWKCIHVILFSRMRVNSLPLRGLCWSFPISAQCKSLVVRCCDDTRLLVRYRPAHH